METEKTFYDISPFMSLSAAMGAGEPMTEDMQVFSYEANSRCCQCAAEMANPSSPWHGTYLQYLEQARSVKKGIYQFIGMHEGFPLLYEIICEDDLTKHTALWLRLGDLMLVHEAMTREKVSPYPGQSILQ